MNKILIIDNDTTRLGSLSEVLKEANYQVTSISNAVEGLTKVSDDLWNLILLSYDLSEMTSVDFINLAAKIRGGLKIVVFSEEINDRIELDVLNTSAIDCIRMTNEYDIILNRVDRLVNKTAIVDSEQTSGKNGIKIDTKFRCVYKNDKEIVLSNIEFEMLRLLLENKNKPLSRNFFHNEIWVRKNKPLDKLRTIDVHMLNLRNKLNVDCIVTRRGLGYVWEE